MQEERYIATADLGSGKIALGVAKVTGNDVQIIYYREIPSDGIRYSCVFNPMKASRPLVAAIKDAEEELRISIRQLVVGLPRYNVAQEVRTAKLERVNPSSCITAEEIHMLKMMAMDNYPLENPEKREIYGAVVQSFNADDLIQQSERDIEGATAEAIEGNYKIFIGARKPSDNIDVMLNNAGVALACKIFVPDAVAGAVLSEEEKENGVALVEMGAGVTSLAIYQGGVMRHYSSIPFGGWSITNDVKHECGFSEKLAENIKLAYGACLPEKLSSLGEKIIRVNDDENGTYQDLPAKYLSDIITCRAREIIDAILFRIQECGFAERLRSGIVLTGGCAALPNLATMVKEMAGYNVRIGYPRTRNFISTGCIGLGETGAVGTVGLILTARRDPNLNCTTAPAPEPEPEPVYEEEEEYCEEPEPIEEVDNYTGTILDPDRKESQEEKALRKQEDKLRKEAERKAREEQKARERAEREARKAGQPVKPKITWDIKSRISNVVNNAFDNTLGSLFDDMG